MAHLVCMVPLISQGIAQASVKSKSLALVARAAHLFPFRPVTYIAASYSKNPLNSSHVQFISDSTRTILFLRPTQIRSCRFFFPTARRRKEIAPPSHPFPQDTSPGSNFRTFPRKLLEAVDRLTFDPREETRNFDRFSVALHSQFWDCYYRLRFRQASGEGTIGRGTYLNGIFPWRAAGLYATNVDAGF